MKYFTNLTFATVYWTSHQCNENQQQYSFISFEKYGLQVNLVLRFDAEINSGNRLWPVIHEKTDTILRGVSKTEVIHLSPLILEVVWVDS